MSRAMLAIRRVHRAAPNAAPPLASCGAMASHVQSSALAPQRRKMACFAGVATRPVVLCARTPLPGLVTAACAAERVGLASPPPSPAAAALAPPLDCDTCIAGAA
eukprot:CAMPEP_0182895240 /NCGR_PEP_ID=MMETSP0034_2-20130328/25565_1 /TAXON_ID=156128 /ORGANISM="Nephroselmis pyriformis, Strain CCMP717" /LENGTH=104 /DNA_ID=CAMNT_0025029063 /DNA_START=189 /DNA_END=500 /DNA_ORIENTATION=+